MNQPCRGLSIILVLAPKSVVVNVRKFLSTGDCIQLITRSSLIARQLIKPTGRSLQLRVDANACVHDDPPRALLLSDTAGRCASFTGCSQPEVKAVNTGLTTWRHTPERATPGTGTTDLSRSLAPTIGVADLRKFVLHESHTQLSQRQAWQPPPPNH